MHADEIPIDRDSVARLVASQFPQWAHLPIRPVYSSGTVNAIFRLGSDFCVRLPRVPWGASDIERERAVLPRLAPHLPVAVPVVLGAGRPDATFPWPWSIYAWIEGDHPVEGDAAGADSLARDLARFILALRSIDPADAPEAYRGGPLTTRDAQTREALQQLEQDIDTAVVLRIWEEALALPAWDRPRVWIHSDLMPGNLLVRSSRLHAVIDFATAGAGDPAADLIVAWNLLPASARGVFREAVEVDAHTWLRGRAWALHMAIVQLPYYRNTNPAMARNARYVIEQVLADNTSA